jgi:molybdate transport system regulatory protein
VNAEVVIELADGFEGLRHRHPRRGGELGLAPGVSATAVINASHIILGVPA